MADILIEINSIYKSFGDLKVLDDVSFDVKKGENLVVFGRSGTGKSVLLKCLIGLFEWDKGEIKIKGKSLKGISDSEMNKLRRHIGFLFQGAALYDSMSVRENLKFPLRRQTDMEEKEMDEKAADFLEKVGLEDAIDKMPSELSGGMRKRIGLARSIITEPEIMFYDEPTTGLDPITGKEISELILNLQHELKMTSIVVTHDIVCANIIADRAIFLKDGKLIYEGDMQELSESDDPFLKNFFSTEIIKE